MLQRLVSGSTYANVDSFGQVGADPGTEWGTGLASTADNTLVRSATVTSGDTNPFDAFNPADQWTGYANDTTSNLGSHTAGPASYGIAALSADKVEGDAGTTAYTFTVTRPSGTGAEIISYTVTGTGSGPAAADAEDFAGSVYPTGSVAFADGVTSMTLTINVAGELLNEVDEAFTVTLGVPDAPSAQGTIRNDDILLTEIHDIQGAAHRSPLEGQTVATIGIVTGITSNGFWIQDPTPDADARTSEGIFVFTNARPASNIVVGDEVRVSGRVTEFFPDSGTTAELSLTEIATSNGGFVQRTGSTGTVQATLIGEGGLLPPTVAYGDDTDQFDPATQGLDFWESLEGMRVILHDAVATGPSDTSSFGDSETFIRLGGTNAGTLTPSGGIIAQEGDSNPERIAVQEDNRVLDNDYRANVGDRLGDVTGVVNYDSTGSYEVIATQAFTVTDGGLRRETSTTLRADADHLTMASYNAENLAFTNDASKFIQIAQQIVNVLGAPDIVALQEVQDDNGAAGGGVVSAEQTLQRLVNDINAVAGPNGPHYAWAYVTPEYNQDGGQQSGNIRQAFLYNTDRVQLAAGAVGAPTMP
ncbi:hypothetical protein [Sphingomonas piscis]|uniref:hypothetical protein n=1 Tax=Sphingomonas piscis TaxID=2714943 RepID=UPI0019D0A23C|nr:hypothetical protein [Sphingomonas piscis]